MLALQTAVGVTKDVDRPPEHFEICVTPPQPAGRLDVSIATKISALLRAAAVTFAVVLVERLTAEQPQVAAGHHASLDPELVLWDDADVAHEVEQTEQRLVRRLRPPVGQGNSLSQTSDTVAPSGARAGELVPGDVTAVKGRVENYDDIEESEVASQRQQDVGRRDDRQSPHPRDGRLGCRSDDA
jgi:hypothetical protein